MGDTVGVEQKPLAPGLYLVATPIGNLEDMTLRALRVLTLADRIACEDTRQTQKLLNHFAIQTPTVSYHLFNEAARSAELIAELKAGARVAIVSDAGTPGIADPGSFLVQAAVAAGVPVVPIPGANAAICGIIASGLSTERFTFHGFLESKGGARRTQLEALGRGPGTHIFYETPHRILEALADIEALYGPGQPVAIARELTKLHEEFLRGPVSELRRTLGGRAHVRGEMVLMFELASEQMPASTANVRDAVSAIVRLEGIPEKDALKRVARERGISKSDAYRELQREQARKK